MTTPIRAVLLDIDDTLLDTTTAMITAGQVGMSAVWPEQSAAWHASAAVRFRTDPEGYFARYTRGELAFDDMREQRLAAVARDLAVDLPGDAFTIYERAYRPVFEREQRVFPDVRPFLDHCAARDVAVGALTNSAGTVTADKLRATGTAHWYAVVITRDSLGFGKPDPRIFHHACAELGVPAAGTAYVGDEVEADVLGASRAGLRAVWVRRPASVPGQARPHQTEPSEALPEDTIVVPDLTTLQSALDLGSAGSGR